MRLGLVGPCHGDRVGLRRRLEFLLDEAHADRVIYLGMDGALDDVVKRWALELVRGDPSDEAVWARAVSACLRGTPEDIDGFLKTERRRRRLKLIECLPGPETRAVEMFDGVVAVVIFDKSFLQEEDILPAAILVLGKADQPMIHRVGPRTFIAPGPVPHADGGSAMLTSDDGDVTVTLYRGDGSEVERHLAARAGAGLAAEVLGEQAT